jgi:hypothetical protein
MAALIALLNEALRRFDDPRSITRAAITLIREGAESLDRDGDRMQDNPNMSRSSHPAELMTKASTLSEFADALESILPPTEAGPQ